MRDAAHNLTSLSNGGAAVESFAQKPGMQLRVPPESNVGLLHSVHERSRPCPAGLRRREGFRSAPVGRTGSLPGRIAIERATFYKTITL